MSTTTFAVTVQPKFPCFSSFTLTLLIFFPVCFHVNKHFSFSSTYSADVFRLSLPMIFFLAFLPTLSIFSFSHANNQFSLLFRLLSYFFFFHGINDLSCFLLTFQIFSVFSCQQSFIPSFLLTLLIFPSFSMPLILFLHVCSLRNFFFYGKNHLSFFSAHFANLFCIFYVKDFLFLLFHPLCGYFFSCQWSFFLFPAHFAGCFFLLLTIIFSFFFSPFADFVFFMPMIIFLSFCSLC